MFVRVISFFCEQYLTLLIKKITIVQSNKILWQVPLLHQVKETTCLATKINELDTVNALIP